jgi:dCMP deaminase
MNRRLLKDQINMRIALIVSELSTCARHKVGAALVRDDRILSTGRNGVRKGEAHCCDLMESGQLSYEDHHLWSLDNEIHAEVNAINFARSYGIPTTHATLYCTHSPCINCANFIVEQSKISRIVYIERYDNSGEIELFFASKNMEVFRFDVTLNGLRSRSISTNELFTEAREY